jgi:2-polyprenyl-3-methyl-5-hydroxy-6-metoxy-1,4-benzoquinol methylase
MRQADGKGISQKFLALPTSDISDGDREDLFRIAKNNGMKLHYFKKSDRMMPRVHKVLGFLRGITFTSLLDVGSGRGVFLLPFLEAFPYVKVTSLEILPKRIELLSDISRGGIDRLTVIPEDICRVSSDLIPDKSYDVVTMLEVLEHIPDVRAALKNAVRIAKKFIVITVPSKEDDNPEHIHLLTKDILTAYFAELGVKRLSFDGVPCHLFMIARLEG